MQIDKYDLYEMRKFFREGMSVDEISEQIDLPVRLVCRHLSKELKEAEARHNCCTNINNFTDNEFINFVRFEFSHADDLEQLQSIFVSIREDLNVHSNKLQILRSLFDEMLAV